MTPLQTTFGAVRAMLLAHVPPLVVQRDAPGDLRLARSASADIAVATLALDADAVHLELGGHPPQRIGAPDAARFEAIAVTLARLAKA